MKDERYTIEVGAGVVIIHGYLTIREAFDFLAFFDQQGYTSVYPGDENSAMRLVKTDCTEGYVESQLHEKREKAFEFLYEKEKKTNLELIENIRFLEERLIHLENALGTFGADSNNACEEYKKQQSLEYKKIRLMALRANPKIRDILNEFENSSSIDKNQAANQEECHDARCTE